MQKWRILSLRSIITSELSVKRLRKAGVAGTLKLRRNPADEGVAGGMEV
jgi:hypothetical protein